MAVFIPEGEWQLEATHLRDRRYAVRPKGCLGTCGWIGDFAWTVVYVNARSEREAVRKAMIRLVYDFREDEHG